MHSGYMSRDVYVSGANCMYYVYIYVCIYIYTLMSCPQDDIVSLTRPKQNYMLQCFRVALRHCRIMSSRRISEWLSWTRSDADLSQFVYVLMPRLMAGAVQQAARCPEL